MLTYRIRFPYSYMGYTYVPRALSMTAANDDICPACARLLAQQGRRQQGRRDPHDTMQGDDPLASGRFHPAGGTGRTQHSRRRSGGAGSDYRGGESRSQQQQSGRIAESSGQGQGQGHSHHRRGGGGGGEGRGRGGGGGRGLNQQRSGSGSSSSSRSGRGRNLNRSRCPRDDELCRELRRGRRRYTRFRSQHALSRHSQATEDEILRLFGLGGEQSGGIGGGGRGSSRRRAGSGMSGGPVA